MKILKSIDLIDPNIDLCATPADIFAHSLNKLFYFAALKPIS